MMTETKITAKLISILRHKHHAKVLNICGNVFQGSSWPDMYIVHWKFIGFIECKGQKTKLEPLQIVTMREIIKRGGVAYVLRFTHERAWRLSTFNEEEVLKEFRFDTYFSAAEQLMDALEELQSGS